MKPLDVIAIIPARMGSSRFPGKPLASILGRPMIEHVYRRCSLCRRIKGVYVATCDTEIRRVVEGFGGAVVMTSDHHQRPSTRVAEAARGLAADVVVMVQGDEPMIVPDMIERSVEPFFQDPAVVCVNLIQRIDQDEDVRDPNTIKVVMDRHGHALYFSRQPVPGFHPGEHRMPEVPFYKQVCVIPFRRDFLLLYDQLAPTPLELIESIDMLRVLEHGHRVRLVETPFKTHAVDTPADLARVESRMLSDPLVAAYAPPAPSHA